MQRKFPWINWKVVNNDLLLHVLTFCYIMFSSHEIVIGGVTYCKFWIYKVGLNIKFTIWQEGEDQLLLHLMIGCIWFYCPFSKIYCVHMETSPLYRRRAAKIFGLCSALMAFEPGGIRKPSRDMGLFFKKKKDTK